MANNIIAAADIIAATDIAATDNDKTELQKEKEKVALLSMAIKNFPNSIDRIWKILQQTADSKKAIEDAIYSYFAVISSIR